MPRPGGPVGAGKTSALRWPPACCVHGEGWCEAGERDLARYRARHRRSRRDPPLRLRVSGVRPLPAPQRMAERGLRVAGVPRRERRKRAFELLERFGLAEEGGGRPRLLSGGRAAAGGRGPRAGSRARRAAAGRAPVGAGRAHPGRAPRGSWRWCCPKPNAPALLVTHDFAEAAQLGDRVGVIDSGRVVQEGTPTELAASPRSAFVADFTGAVVLTGRCGWRRTGVTRVELDGGGAVTSTDAGSGPVAVASTRGRSRSSRRARSRTRVGTQPRVCEVVSITRSGNRVRLGSQGRNAGRRDNSNVG